jgi:hypothetical protein
VNEVGTTRVTWRKSTRSNGSGDCVEVADLGGVVGVRDSKDHDGPVLVFAPVPWSNFLSCLNDGRVTGRPL